MTSGGDLGSGRFRGRNREGEFTWGQTRRSRNLLNLSALFHVLRPVCLLTYFVAVVGIPATVVLGLIHTIGAL